MSFDVGTIENIYQLQYIYNYYDEITINAKKLKYTGTLRYAFKYALWALKVGGEIEIIDEPFRDFGFSTKRIDFWQIRHELFKSLKNDIEILELDNTKGLIKVKKIKESYINSGFSFGIVFSGSESEKEQLTKSVQSILYNIDLNKYDYEIIICGPSNFDSESYLEQFISFDVKYLSFDFEPNAKRLMITQKKNYLYENCKYNIVSINHTRIVYANDFMVKTFDKKFDVFTPKVMVEENGKWYRYLDFGLIGSFNTSKVNSASVMSSIYLNDEILYFMKKRMPYIDGALSIFNKKVISLPYNENIAWQEAEDIDLSMNLINKGYLISYFYDIQNISLVSKFNIKLNFIRKLKIFIIRQFVYWGLI